MRHGGKALAGLGKSRVQIRAAVDLELQRVQPRLGRRMALEQSAEEHKQLKGVMPDAEWQAQFEKMMLELAQVSAEIRKKS